MDGLLTDGAMPVFAQAVIDQGALAAPGGAADFSVMTMFLRATLTVQVVMVLLVLASFWSWAIMIEKWLLFRRLERKDKAFEETFWSGRSIDDLYDALPDDGSSPVERVFAAGMLEWRRSFGDGRILPGTQARVERAMSVTIAREADAVQRRLAFLATVGPVAPFVGLFGTVWGIKHSFESIATQQNTNLAVVAPGIAEALLATAIGLLAAIPAVMAYNWLTGRSDRLSAGLENFADEFTTILARQIDRKAMATVEAA